MADVIVLNYDQDNFASYYDVATGRLVWSLYDQDQEVQKYYLKLTQSISGGFGDSITVTQDRNSNGSAHFDISTLLKTKLGFKSNTPLTSILSLGDNEIKDYRITVGYQDVNGQQYFEGSFPSSQYGSLTVLNGRKPFNQVGWNWADYTYSYAAGGSVSSLFNVITASAKPMSDYNPTPRSFFELDDNVCYSLPSNPYEYQTRKMYRTDEVTLSYFAMGNPTTGSARTYGWDKLGIRGFFFTFHASDGTQLYQADIKNTISNGGGPLNNATDYYTPDPLTFIPKLKNGNKIINLQIGASNELINSYIADTDVAYCLMFPYVDGFWSSSNPSTEDDCFTQSASLTAQRAGLWQKIEFMDSECNDFDHIQFAWINSFGVYDYFTFTKRNDKKANATKKSFYRNDPDWDSYSFAIDPLSRGTVTVNTDVTEGGSASTNYLSDEDSLFLKNLIISPSVMAKIDGEWKPVVITDTQWTEQTFRKDRLFQLTVNYDLANKNLIQ